MSNTLLAIIVGVLSLIASAFAFPRALLYAKKHNIRPGIGLAAIQIGLLKRMFVIYYGEGEDLVQYQLVNPKIIEYSLRKCALKDGEGCLSVDNEHPGYAHRYYKIKLKAFDALTNQEVVITARGFDAIVLQHEYDHLDGLFFYDRIDKNKPSIQLMNEELIQFYYYLL